MPVKIGGINDGLNLNNDIATDDYLQVNSCGITNGATEAPVTIRPHGRTDYQLLIAVEGEALFKYRNDDILLKAGDAIILPPRIKNHYFFYPDSNIVWIHFTGSSVEKILQEYSLKGYTPYSVSDPDDFLWHAEKIIDEFRLKRIGYMNNCNASLLNILTLLKRKIDSKIDSSSENFMPEIALVIEEMKMHFPENRSIEEFAKVCNLSASRFAHLFTRKVGISPYRYLLNLRIKQAKFLLINTNLSISDIAKSVGYDDPLHFSRIFKKYEGVSPTQFKKNYKMFN